VGSLLSRDPVLTGVAPSEVAGTQLVASGRRHSQNLAPNASFCRISGNQFSTRKPRQSMPGTRLGFRHRRSFAGFRPTTLFGLLQSAVETRFPATQKGRRVQTWLVLEAKRKAERRVAFEAGKLGFGGV
jgi:hypothetical protein